MQSTDKEFDLEIYKKEFVDMKSNQGELQKESFLNSTTGFFRDLEVFEYLKETLKKEKKKKIRVLNIGCSTGEETYSLAMVFQEVEIDFLIFGTDINEESLNCSSRGAYEKVDLLPLSKKQKENFFTCVDDTYFVNKNLKSKIMFLKESINHLKKYNEIDLVVCRNLLIYLKKEVQNTFAKDIHKLLKEDGIVVLGKSEYPEEFDKLFDNIDFSKKIFRKRKL
ncbi:MAG: methyltransferase domain-containing protein [Campylobacterales bacterium]|nr:methyltransferase domain-containing protein [Campylobacterales bacterium]